MTANQRGDLGSPSGPETCPSCQSDQWKSAKAVILEGTTMTAGQIEGSVRDKGLFGGGTRSFLLSDRWFSRDYAIGAEVNLVTITGLAETVKTHLVSQAELKPMPLPPAPIKKIGLLERESPRAPTRPSAEPNIPVVPTAPHDKPWHAHFGTALVSDLMWCVGLGLIGGILAAFVFGILGVGVVVLTAVAFFVISVPVDLFRSFSGNRVAQEEHAKKLAEYPAQVELAKERHKNELARFEELQIDYKRSLSKAAAQAAFEASELARFERESFVFETEKAKVALHREQLWERSRVCSRCSTAYIPDSLSRSLLISE
jgi:hypothetical protein